MTAEGLMTVSDFIREYRVPRTTLYRLVHDGKIPIVKIGRASRIPRADAQAWAESLPAIGKEARDG